MNRQLRRLAAGLIVLYLAVFGMLNRAQVFEKEALDTHPDNNRQDIRDFNRPRGQIVTADGVVVAQSEALEGYEFDYLRSYPLGDLFGNVTGYYTYGFGSTQIEKRFSEVLMGDTAAQKITGVLNDDNSGNVVLTLRADVQRVAAEALGNREGSVVVMDPATGAVIAMVSTPRIDPNLIADPDAEAAQAALEAYGSAAGKPLLANAYQERYMPGSAFKVITTGIALERGAAGLDTTWPVEQAWVPPQTDDPIENYGGRECGGAMAEVFWRSCNIPFAKMAVTLGPDDMVAGAREWGVGERIPFDLPAPASSNFEFAGDDPIDFAQNLPLLAIAGFGQANDAMTPLHMCMVASTVANGGRMMSPFAVARTTSHDGLVLDETEPQLWRTPISPLTASILNQLMQGVVNNGTGTPMQLAGGVQAAAKTGTAQLNGPGEPERSHAWIIGFAPASAPRYAIAVMLKGTTDEISAGTGGRLAGPIAKVILDYLMANPLSVNP
ncbi:MAG: peptidoglycan D,D-transpeptidase FtsI family protein [Ilumatobacteraceae bacterium]